MPVLGWIQNLALGGGGGEVVAGVGGMFFDRIEAYTGGFDTAETFTGGADRIEGFTGGFDTVESN